MDTSTQALYNVLLDNLEEAITRTHHALGLSLRDSETLRKEVLHPGSDLRVRLDEIGRLARLTDEMTKKELPTKGTLTSVAKAVDSLTPKEGVK